jgi:hypothetical protein
MDRLDQALLENAVCRSRLTSLAASLIHLGVKDVVIVKALLLDATRLRYMSVQ